MENAAAGHKRHVVPVLSVSVDFYVRMFLRVYSSPVGEPTRAGRNARSRALGERPRAAPAMSWVGLSLRFQLAHLIRPAPVMASAGRIEELREPAFIRAWAPAARCSPPQAACLPYAAPTPCESPKPVCRIAGPTPISRTPQVYHCVGCEAFALQPVGRVIQKNDKPKHLPGYGPAVGDECVHCRSRHTMGGPIWNGPIHDPVWVKELLELLTRDRFKFPGYDKVHALLTTVAEELIDIPLYHSTHDLCAPAFEAKAEGGVRGAGGGEWGFFFLREIVFGVSAWMREGFSAPRTGPGWEAGGVCALPPLTRRTFAPPFIPRRQHPPLLASTRGAHAQRAPQRWVPGVFQPRQPAGAQDRRALRGHLGHPAVLG